MHTGLLTWIATFPPGTGAVVGPLIGSAFGLIAILIGAFFNAHLNRRRDERLLDSERYALATDLTAELRSVQDTLVGNASTLEQNPSPSSMFMMPDIGHSIQIFSQISPKLGLLDPDTIKHVIEAHIRIAQYGEHLILLGGQLQDNMPANRRVMLMDVRVAPEVAKHNRALATCMDEALQSLELYLPK